MKGPQFLIGAENNWQTDMGALFNGERVVFRGKDLFTELKDFSWFKNFLFGITGIHYSTAEIEMVEKMWSLTSSYPDPRIWNNRVSALTGSARSTGQLATSASTSISEASIYGNQINIAAFEFLLRANKIADSMNSLTQFVISEIKNKRFIAGYGRPIFRKDERVQPLIEAAEKLGLSSGRYLKVALEVEKILIDNQYRMNINAAGVCASLMADMGFSIKDHYYCSVLSFSAGIIPCYIDAVDHKEGSFFPLTCQRLNYTGKGLRHW